MKMVKLTKGDVDFEIVHEVTCNGLVNTKVQPEQTGFEIDEFVGKMKAFKELLNTVLSTISDDSRIKAKVFVQVVKGQR